MFALCRYGDFFVADNRFASLEEVVAHYSNEPLCEDLVFEYPVAPAVAGGALDYTKSVVALVSVAGDGYDSFDIILDRFSRKSQR